MRASKLDAMLRHGDHSIRERGGGGENWKSIALIILNWLSIAIGL